MQVSITGKYMTIKATKYHTITAFTTASDNDACSVITNKHDQPVDWDEVREIVASARAKYSNLNKFVSDNCNDLPTKHQEGYYLQAKRTYQRTATVAILTSCLCVLTLAVTALAYFSDCM